MDVRTRSLRRSRDRLAVAEAAEALGRADIAALANAARVRIGRASEAIEGSPDYRHDYSLWFAGILARHEDGERVEFELTAAGADALEAHRRAVAAARRKTVR